MLKLEREFEESDLYVKFGRNRVINDLVRVSKKEDGQMDG